MNSYNAELILYQEALSCLNAASEESQKTANVDITLMLQNCEKCAEVVRSLQLLDANPERQTGLEELCASLSDHQEILAAKIHQLKGTAAAVPSEPPPQRSSDANVDEAHDEKNSTVDDERSRLQAAIAATIVPKGSTCLSNVVGLEEAKQSLREAIILPALHPHLFTGGRQPWRRILLYGPPGTGKSHLAKAVSKEIQSTFYCVSSSDLLSSWFGESEKLIKELFRHATNQSGTSVVFIDEIDSICRQRSSREEEGTRRIKTELLTQMEGAASSSLSLFLLCATNCPWELDSAFLRRFQKRIYIPLPDEAARLAQLKMQCAETSVALTTDQWAELVQLTEGYSGSDIANLVLGALFEPIRHMQQASHWIHTTDGLLKPCSSLRSGAVQASMADLPHDKMQPGEVCMDDFLASLKNHSKTVNPHELAKFEAFTASHGQVG